MPAGRRLAAWPTALLTVVVALAVAWVICKEPAATAANRKEEVDDDDDDDSVVTVQGLGKVQALLWSSSDGRPFRAFLQIPYAAPPVGELRFARPRAPAPWDGIRRKTENDLVECAQMDFLVGVCYSAQLSWTGDRIVVFFVFVRRRSEVRTTASTLTCTCPLWRTKPLPTWP